MENGQTENFRKGPRDRRRPALLNPVEADDQVNQTNTLVRANEQLVLATLNAQAEADAATSALKQAALAAELEAVTSVSRSKTDFLARVSHELRTPLNAVLGFGQLMLMDDDEHQYLDAAQRGRLEAIRLAGQQLLSLTSDMLDLARIEQGRVRMDIKGMKLDGVINSSMTMVEPSTLSRNIDIRYDCCDYVVLADERALSQVMLNLLSNAVKYNAPAAG
ncbi:MAG: sensory box histidine kinase/response regulator [Verrucomicrobiaceae bacterium]|nr:sensory box histidine kinase/response regulator [Verrucomicrobiaceae bacterium]